MLPCYLNSQTVSRPNSDQVSDLLNHIKTSGQYDGLLRSLIDVGQQDVVTSVLGEDLGRFYVSSLSKGW